MNDKRAHTWIILGAVGLALATLLLLVGYAAASSTPGPMPVSPLTQSDDAPALGADVLLSTFRTDDYHAALAYNSDEQEFLVVWSHQGDIYGQRYDWQGVPLSQNFAISTAPNGKNRPAVDYCPNTGSYLVVWDDYRNSTDREVYGQRVAANGTLLDNPDPDVNFPVYTGAGDQRHVDLGFDGTSYLVVWQGDQDGFLQIYGRSVACDGTVAPTVHTISGSGSVDRQAPAVAHNAAQDEYQVVFQYDDQADAEIHGRRVAPDGAVLGSEYTIADQPFAEGPDVAAANGDFYVVVWSDARTGHAFIYGQVVQAGADSLVGSDFEICTIVYNHGDPAIARSPSTGQFLVVWKDGRQGTDTGWNIYGQRLLGDATLDGTNFAICAADGDQYKPAIASSQLPDIYFVAWEDRRNGTYDVYGQRVARTGALLWYESAISAEPGQQMPYPAVAYNGDDQQYLAVWADLYTGEIYGLRLSADGQPLEEPWIIESAASSMDINLDATYNSSRNHYLVIWNDADADHIVGRRVYPAGKSTDYFVVEDSNGGQFPSMAYDAASDYFLVAWQAAGDIYARLLDGQGMTLGSLIEVSTAADEQKDPDVAFDPDHEQFLVVWGTDRPASGDDDIEGRIVLTDGTPLAPSFCLAGCSDANRRELPAVTYNPDDDEYMVVYQYVQAPNDLDLYGRRATWDGNVTGSEFDVWTETGGVHQQEADIVYIPALNRYYVIWADGRNSADNGYDLYGRWLGADGSPVGFSIPVFRYPGGQRWPDLAYDAAHQQALVVWNDTRRSYDGTYARLGVLDTAPPRAGFLRIPSSGGVGTTFTFNAWPSSDDFTPRGALMVRWDWDYDGSFDTVWSFDKVITRTVGLQGIHTVTLEVRDMMWFTDTASLPIVVLPATANTPPTAALTVAPLSGIAGTDFQFDASGSADAETPGSLQARWDWEGDGLFDIDFSASLIASHVYTVAGDYTVRVEVVDGGGLTDATAGNLFVSASAVTDLEVSPSTATMIPLETILFRATTWDGYGNEMSNPDVVWSVTQGTAGTIDSLGFFTASKHAGVYVDVILATSNGAADSASVTIIWPYRVYLPVVLRQAP